LRQRLAKTARHTFDDEHRCTRGGERATVREQGSGSIRCLLPARRTEGH
jgi:hypothetical protein